MRNFAVSMLVFGFIYILLFTSSIPALAEEALSVEYESTPLFNQTRFAPGDTISRWIKVKNVGSLGRMLVVNITKHSTSVPDSPTLLDVLYVSIRTAGRGIWQGSLAELVEEGQLALVFLPPQGTIVLNMSITMSTDAGNQYQGKVVDFDLAVGFEAVDHLVINEVYYQVAEDKGFDAPADRRENLGYWEQVCWLDEEPSWVGRNIWVQRVWHSWLGRVCSRLLRNNEWVEIYNPTDVAWEVGGWGLEDNSGESIVFRDRVIRPGEYLWVAKDISTLGFWSRAGKAMKIFTGKQIGDGLDNLGDHLLLLDTTGKVIDAVGWGNDSFVWSPACSLVPIGSSLAREDTGWDSDLANDFVGQVLPSPGKN